MLERGLVRGGNSSVLSKLPVVVYKLETAKKNDNDLRVSAQAYYGYRINERTMAAPKHCSQCVLVSFYRHGVVAGLTKQSFSHSCHEVQKAVGILRSLFPYHGIKFIWPWRYLWITKFEDKGECVLGYHQGQQGDRI